ncbi:hypothetical protein KJ708_00060, partial [bacterium]|nr:hypothetical protein [bacterium]
MKKSFLIFAVIFVLLFLITFVNAESCCKESFSKGYCVDVPEDQCKLDSEYEGRACRYTTFCRQGTCVDMGTGTCTKNTEKALCELGKGGDWDERGRDEINVCQKGCATFGTKTAFVTEIQAKQISTDYAIPYKFRSDINGEQECTSLVISEDKGACVTKEDYEIDCENYVLRKACSGENQDFYSGLLCTATELETTCTPSKEKMCYTEGKDSKVYFKDTCGNRANVYYKDMFPINNEVSKEYWTKIKEPVCIFDINDPKKCGNCDYIEGSVCGEVSNNNYECKSLGCEYHGQTYEHGESWCADSPGTYPHLPMKLVYDPANSDLTQNELKKVETAREELENTDKYNIPGSRYYKLLCWDGEVIPYECADYRQEICVDEEIPNTNGFTHAECVSNNYLSCANIANKAECESTLNMCSWVQGYRTDRKNVNEKAYKTDPYNEEEQGTCVPLIPPGIDFWEPESNGQNYCTLAGSIVEITQYETHWLAGMTEGTTQSDVRDSYLDKTNRCYDNCYVIPGYGINFVDNQKYINEIEPLMGNVGSKNRDLKSLKKFTKAKNDKLGISTNIEGNLFISDRRGYYCKGATGEIWGDTLKCSIVYGKNTEHNERKI